MKKKVVQNKRHKITENFRETQNHSILIIPMLVIFEKEPIYHQQTLTAVHNNVDGVLIMIP